MSSKEQSFREALARIASGFYTEKGAENHAKDIIRLVDESGVDSQPTVFSSNSMTLVERLRDVADCGFFHMSLFAEAANEIERLTNQLRQSCDDARSDPEYGGCPLQSETKAECPTGVRPHDLCSAGTCSTCTDAERYRFIRQSETRLDPFEEEVYGEVWKAILPKGCDEEKMDAAIDAGLKRLGLKTEGSQP